MIQEKLVQFYEKSFRSNWDNPALADYFKRETFTYGEVAAEIAKLHILFETCGIKQGDKIALIGRNNPRWCISFLATVTYGAVIVPILQDFNSNDVHHIINHSDSVFLFCGDQFWDSIDEDNIGRIKGALSLTDFGPLYDNCLGLVETTQDDIETLFEARYPAGFSASDVTYPDIPNSQLAMINYTSGTTGFSKGVMLTGNNLAGNIVFGLNTRLHYPGSRALSFLPLAHAYGCMFDFLFALAAGASVTLLGKIPSPKILIEAMAEVKPHLVFCVPLIIEKMYKKQILPLLDKNVLKLAMKLPLIESGVNMTIRKKLMDAFGGQFTQVIVGGAPMNAEVEDFLRRIEFPFTVGYGMTECAPLVSYTHWKDYKLTSCGRVLDGLMEARIDSADPQTIAGEICVRGENVMVGYYKNEAVTADVLGPDGWLRTGDVGTMDPDGTIYIRGRSKSMILRSNGQNIYPEELESRLNNLPCVMESLVVERDGRLVALVYPDYDQADSGGVSQYGLKGVMDENLRILNSQVASYERVAEIVLYPTEFEKTPKRSIRRYLYNV